jgi:hypothetical protein
MYESSCARRALIDDVKLSKRSIVISQAAQALGLIVVNKFQ